MPTPGSSSPRGSALVEDPAAYRHISSERKHVEVDERWEAARRSGTVAAASRARSLLGLVGGPPKRLLDRRARRRTSRARSFARASSGLVDLDRRRSHVYIMNVSCIHISGGLDLELGLETGAARLRTGLQPLLVGLDAVVQAPSSGGSRPQRRRRRRSPRHGRARAARRLPRACPAGRRRGREARSTRQAPHGHSRRGTGRALRRPPPAAGTRRAGRRRSPPRRGAGEQSSRLLAPSPDRAQEQRHRQPLRGG